MASQVQNRCHRLKKMSSPFDTYMTSMHVCAKAYSHSPYKIVRIFFFFFFAVTHHVLSYTSGVQVWIGGEYSDGAWRWITSDVTIDPSFSGWGYRGSASTSVGFCLAYAVNDAYFCDLFDYNCAYQRPYLCERNL